MGLPLSRPLFALLTDWRSSPSFSRYRLTVFDMKRILAAGGDVCPEWWSCPFSRILSAICSLHSINLKFERFSVHDTFSFVSYILSPRIWQDMWDYCTSRNFLYVSRFADYVVHSESISRRDSMLISRPRLYHNNWSNAFARR